MIAAVDVETRGLDATKFVIAAFMQEGRRKAEFFYNKRDLWNHILELGEKLNKREKTLSLYAHNAAYDFYGYADLNDHNIRWFSERPFIVAYRQGNRETIKFLDTMSLFKMSLEKLGTMMGIPKLPMPPELLGEETIPDPTELRKYVERDTFITLKSVLYLKEMLKKDRVHVRRLYTINQVAINYLLNHWRINYPYNWLFWEPKSGELRKTQWTEEIHGAYRGGRVEAFQMGVFKHTYHYDINSLYPYAAINMRFPDLKSEKKLYNPLQNIGMQNMISHIGIARCSFTNAHDTIGFLPVRTPTGNYYPKPGTTLIGTFTTDEIKEALNSGYTFNDCEWCVLYKDAPTNPMKGYMEHMYELRMKNRENEMLNYFYKMMMNSAIGKLAQTRIGQEMTIDSVEMADEYLKRNMRIIRGIDLNYLYASEQKTELKKYYAPIIPTLINALARVYMHRHLKMISPKNLLYSDTDSIFCIGDHSHMLPIGEEMGMFKTEHQDAECVIYGRKTYSIGNEAKISGISRKGLTFDDFKEGLVTNKKMITIKTATRENAPGTFITEQINLPLVRSKHNSILEKYSEHSLFIDDDIKNISFFMPLHPEGKTI